MPNKFFTTLISSQMNEAKTHLHPLVTSSIHWKWLLISSVAPRQEIPLQSLSGVVTSHYTLCSGPGLGGHHAQLLPPHQECGHQGSQHQHCVRGQLGLSVYSHDLISKFISYWNSFLPNSDQGICFFWCGLNLVSAKSLYYHNVDIVTSTK